MENYLDDAYAALTEAFAKLQLAKAAQEEDDYNDEELNREDVEFVERIADMINDVGEIQAAISQMKHEHNNYYRKARTRGMT